MCRFKYQRKMNHYKKKRLSEKCMDNLNNSKHFHVFYLWQKCFIKILLPQIKDMEYYIYNTIRQHIESGKWKKRGKVNLKRNFYYK